VFRRSEDIRQVSVDDTLGPGFDLLPDLAQYILFRPPSPIAEAGGIEYRIEDRLQPI
jgi:hypothetical protein